MEACGGGCSYTLRCVLSSRYRVWVLVMHAPGNASPWWQLGHLPPHHPHMQSNGTQHARRAKQQALGVDFWEDPEQVRASNHDALKRTFGQPDSAIRVKLWRDKAAWCPYCQKVRRWAKPRAGEPRSNRLEGGLAQGAPAGPRGGRGVCCRPCWVKGWAGALLPSLLGQRVGWGPVAVPAGPKGGQGACCRLCGAKGWAGGLLPSLRGLPVCWQTSTLEASPWSCACAQPHRLAQAV